MSKRASGGVAALAALWLAMMLTGTGALDHRLLHALYAMDRPALRAGVIAVTNLGEPWVMVALALVGVAGLLVSRRPRSALLLLAITLVGRGLVELQKLGIGRLRPEDQVHLVPVKSLSFPSGHAANSMIFFLSLALLAPGPRWRRLAVPLALAASAAVGLTRPMLGVHWPSDVIGGWAFGAAWVLAMLGLADRLGGAQDGVEDKGNHKGRQT
jgi:membrane-associated phospholipid phosphatase